jgi:predicted extracellular nuclease
MENYLRRGYSKIIKASDRDVFIKDAEGFIKPVKLNLENYFGINDDFNLIASLMRLNSNNEYILFDITGKL